MYVCMLYLCNVLFTYQKILYIIYIYIYIYMYCYICVYIYISLNVSIFSRFGDPEKVLCYMYMA